MDVSVVLPFSDDEDVIGRSVRRIAAQLRQRRLEFEIICVDEDSGDNSHAVLGLLAGEIPEIRTVTSAGRGRGFEHGASVASASVLWLVSLSASLDDLTAFDEHYQRVAHSALDVAAVEGRFTVCRRSAAAELLRGSRGAVHARIARRAIGRNLRVEHHRSAAGHGSLGRTGPVAGRVQRLVASPLRAAFSWFDA